MRYNHGAIAVPSPLPKRAPSAISQVLEARTGVAPSVRASEVRARAVAVLAACARADHRVRAGLRVDAESSARADEVADGVGGASLDLALVPADAHLEPLGEALVVNVAEDASLAAERAIAPSLARFGARRFLVVVPTETHLLEWWPEMRDFAVYDADVLEDRALTRAVDVSALFADAAARELVVRAAIERNAWPMPLVSEQAVLVERRDALVRLLRARGLAPQRRHLARIDACVDPTQLAAWIELAMRAALADDVFSVDADPQ